MRCSPERELDILRERAMQEFTFDTMLLQLRSLIAGFPDKRVGDNTFYSIEDAALDGAFSIFFTQRPSFLSFQRDMEKSKGKSNAQTIFGMYQIPCDNHIRDLLDVVSPYYIFPMFDYIFNNLNQLGYIEQFRSINNNLLIALDGTQYFSSKKIHCKNCSTQKHNDGTITYSHKAITPVLLAPGIKQVISLEPEFITPQDGHEKQDCENIAAKRLDQYGKEYSKYKATILGDDLYANQPVCKKILDKGFNFILICKPNSHKPLYQWLEDVDPSQIQTKVIIRCNGKRREIDTYRFINQVPIRKGDQALEVNWCELITTLEDGTIIYKNSFITNHEITSNNVVEIVKAGRARWKIENENNNILKTKGYNLEHNFGHGKNHLSSLLMTFNLLAFLFHTVLEILDSKYQVIRKELSARKTFFDDIRALTRYICFKGWDDMLNFMIKGLEIDNLNDS